MIFLIDPAQGGEAFPGFLGAEGLREAEANLLMAQAIAPHLLIPGINLAFTRVRDEHVSHSKRVKMAAAADVTLQIQFSTQALDDQPERLEVRGLKSMPASWGLAETLANELTRGGLVTDLRHHGAHALFSKQTQPAVRLWAGHLLRPETARAVRSGEWGLRVGKLVASGVARFYGL